jgi:hypothetical protein
VIPYIYEDKWLSDEDMQTIKDILNKYGITTYHITGLHLDQDKLCKYAVLTNLADKQAEKHLCVVLQAILQELRDMQKGELLH